MYGRDGVDWTTGLDRVMLVQQQRELNKLDDPGHCVSNANHAAVIDSDDECHRHLGKHSLQGKFCHRGRLLRCLPLFNIHVTNCFICPSGSFTCVV